MSVGRVTLPAEAGMEEVTARLARLWGVDAVRDSDGTRLSDEITGMGFDIYSTLCLVREDLAYAKAHPEQLQCMYLLSRPATARGSELAIDPLEGYFRQQLRVDAFHDPKEWWEVRDRATGAVVAPDRWDWDQRRATVRISDCTAWHHYTVSFLARQIWEPVSMYNHITNGWTGEHRLPLDPRHPEARRHLLDVLDGWLARHPRTTVVRFTTFFYNFDLVYDGQGRERQVDWFGYLGSVSPEALLVFEKERGYRLTPEDFVDQGYYNSPFREPSPRLRDWMEFQQGFVAELARECVQRVHAAGKKAIMFLGDQWIGTEPYGSRFASIGLDGVVGSVGDGVTLRMISDIPTPMREGRFLPYFFPDVFRPGGDPTAEFMAVWNKARRALLHAPLNRMGFGGYLRLAAGFPDFVERVRWACDEFRELWDRKGSDPSWKPAFGVAFLNAWGSLRSWQCWQVTHSAWNQRAYSYLGLLEAASGMNLDVRFLSFDDVLAHGVPDGIGVLVNAGDAMGAWSGGTRWREPRLQEIVRSWVARGGGFIGVGEPTAVEHGGRCFQLEDVLGVQRETGFSLSHRKPVVPRTERHFILGGELQSDARRLSHIDFGEPVSGVYPLSTESAVLERRQGSVTLAANIYGKGRGVYLSGLPFALENAELLRRCIFWASGREDQAGAWHADNPSVAAAYYPARETGIALNLTGQVQSATIRGETGGSIAFVMEPYERRWFSPSEVERPRGA